MTANSATLLPLQSYALKRLARGLASSRHGARQGFALALTQLLTQIPAIETEEVLKLLSEELKTSSTMQVRADKLLPCFLVPGESGS